MPRKTPSPLQRFLNDPAQLWKSVRFHVERKLYPRYKRPVVVLFRYTRAMGDNLMLTTVAREVRKRNPGALIHVVTGLPELFVRNPDVDFVSPDPERPMRGIGQFLIRYEQGFPWTKHFLHYYCECVDIFAGIDLKTYIFPSEADETFAEDLVDRLGGKPILINRMAGPRNAARKQWPERYWLELVEALTEDFSVVDIGAPGPGLSLASPRYLSLQGLTSIHQLAALMRRARLLIGVDSGPLHLGSASGIPTVCILGGSIPPEAIRYPNVTVLAQRPPCSDCWELRSCEQEYACLTTITPDSVLKAAEAICSPLFEVTECQSGYFSRSTT